MEEYIKESDGNGLLTTLLSAKRELLERGRLLYDLSMINPDLDPPRLALDKLTEATLNRKNHRYSVARGVKKFREAFSEKYNKSFGVSLDPELEIVAASGTKDALLLALRCLCSPGDKVLIGSPTYPLYRYAVDYHRLKYETFSLSLDEGEMLSNIEEKLSRDEFKVLLLNFPNNPTGISVSKKFYEKLATIIENRSTIVVNDFVYGELSFLGAPFESALGTSGLKQRCIETYSLSKTYCIPGWRTGALLGTSSIVGKVAKLKSLIDYGTFLPIQYAASAILSESTSIVRSTCDRYGARAKLLGQTLQSLGFGLVVPDGGASLWAKIPEDEIDPGAFLKGLLSSEGVSVLPGSVFGGEYDRYFRCALVVSEEKIHDIGKAISRYIEKGTSHGIDVNDLRPTSP